jgi:hypothetical protein
VRLAQLETEAAGVAALVDVARGETASTAARAAELEALVASLHSRDEPVEASVKQERLTALDRRLREAVGRTGTLAREPAIESPPGDSASAGRHLVFTGEAGAYQLLERSGPAPAQGDTIELDSLVYFVERVAGASLGEASVPCAYVSRLV